MSVAVCRSPAATIHMEPEILHENPRDSQLASEISKKSEYERSDIWSMIQSSSTKTATPPYVHPLMRRSRSLMSQRSLEMCTESLGSETGSDDFSLFSSGSGGGSNDDDYHSTSNKMELKEDVVEEVAAGYGCRRELPAVNYHCSASSRRSPPRSFPPPLPSISRRDGPCLHMRPHRRDGRLVVEAVPVASVNYLHAHRQDGRLLLSFIDTAFYNPNKKEIESDGEMPLSPLDPNQESIHQIEEKEEEEVEVEVEMEMEEEEEEEEVEVVDRGTVVEVKVSTQPQLQSGALKVHRSSLVINKFVGGTPLTNQNRWIEVPPPSPPPLPTAEAAAAGPTRRLVATTTTAAAAAVAASSMTADSEMAGNHRPQSPENKLLFTSKRRNREELLHHMRRCSELRRPLFFWEPCCIATSS